jgi:beta-glucosidase
VGRTTRPVCLLKHFEKQDFKPGKTRELTYTIQPGKGLSHSGASGQRLLADGFFTLRVGGQHQRFRYGGTTAKPAGRR